MNYPMVLSRFGLLSILLSGIMLLMSGFFLAIGTLRGFTTDTHAIAALFVTGAGGLLLGGALWYFNRKGSRYLGRKEALLLVALSWICGAAIAACPYYIWAWEATPAGALHPFQGFISCYFEAMSGLTTTGATVLSDIEAVPKSLLLWRALTHWLGGLGIVVLFVAVLPGLGVGGKRLFQIESPGPAPEGLQPHIRETARWLWYIYLGLTVTEIAALWVFTPMSGFDSICHTFATLATGGFSTRNASVGAFYDSAAVDTIVIIFMILAGVNFGLYYQLRRGNLMSFLRDTEFRFYIFLLMAGTLLVATALALSPQQITLTTAQEVDATLGESLRQGLFTSVAIQTTTGFCTSDFNKWPFLAQSVLVVMMFIGGCSGSTGGGIKVIRIWIMIKVLLSEIEHVFRPSVIRPVRLGRSTIDPDLKLGTICYVLGSVLLVALGAGTIMLIEQLNPDNSCSFTSAATSSVAALFTIGPGLAQVGAVENYGWYSDASKCVLCLLMALGRLEIFAIIVLFSPSFWRRE